MFYILGPCVIESEEHALLMAEQINDICSKCAVDFYFKASFDKANRLSVDSYRGPGIAQGINILKMIKEKIGCRITSDIHEICQVDQASEILDLIQIPALLCRQTDLVQSAAKTNKRINIKKGQFMSPEAMKNIVEKARRVGLGSDKIYLTERGSCFGYGDLVMDMRSIYIMRQLGIGGVIADVSHAVQRPAGAEKHSSGNPEYIPLLARAAAAAGADGIFIEVHDDPKKALSDSMNSLDIKNLLDLIISLELISWSAK